jgi:hypothetical protein
MARKKQSRDQYAVVTRRWHMAARAPIGVPPQGDLFLDAPISVLALRLLAFQFCAGALATPLLTPSRLTFL